ncbi:MAG: hypothetical protein ABIK28_00035 [Planctomycetota bacterium]
MVVWIVKTENRYNTIPSNGILEISTYFPPLVPAPYDLYLQALIGAHLTDLCVLEVR